MSRVACSSTVILDHNGAIVAGQAIRRSDEGGGVYPQSGGTVNAKEGYDIPHNSRPYIGLGITQLQAIRIWSCLITRFKCVLNSHEFSDGSFARSNSFAA